MKTTFKSFSQIPPFAPVGGFPKIANNQVFPPEYKIARDVISSPVTIDNSAFLESKIDVGEVLCWLFVGGMVVGFGYWVFYYKPKEKEEEGHI